MVELNLVEERYLASSRMSNHSRGVGAYLQRVAVFPLQLHPVGPASLFHRGTVFGTKEGLPTDDLIMLA